MPQATNVTKYTAIDSGPSSSYDEVPAGYIKTIENVWLDSYTFSHTATKTVIEIAVLPLNRKITSIELMIETSVSQSSGSIALGFATDALTSFGALMGPFSVTHALTITTLSLCGVMLNNTNAASGRFKINTFQHVISGTRTTIAVQLNNWTMTTGTIKSIVRYT